MPDPLLPFVTIFTPTPDMNLGDIQAEIARLSARNQAISDALEGYLPIDCLFDLLADDGIDPEEWVEVSLANLEEAMSGG